MTPQKITLRRPDDWHLHLRDNDMLKAVLPFTSKDYERAIVMPNLAPPLIKIDDIIAYRDRILMATPKEHTFEPLMTAYLSDKTVPDEIVRGYQNNIIKAVKLYPAHATTNSEHGVSSIEQVFPVLEKMQEHRIPLLIHGEVTDSNVDIFDREAQFIDKVLLGIIKQFPSLPIVLEHITTKEGADFILGGNEYIAATVTPQHLLFNRNALFQGGIRPHHYCLPILKREEHRDALVHAVTSGCDRFFLGTDSAPHEKNKKESSCGCAGAFNSLVALPVYASVFESMNALDKLEAFTSLNGPKFYQLPINSSKITLIKQKQVVPETLEIAGVGHVVPFLAGESLEWSVE